MRAAAVFAHSLVGKNVARIVCRLHGSLALTGKGHGTDRAILLGLLGNQPDTVDVEAIAAMVDAIRRSNRIRLPDGRVISFHEADDLVYDRHKPLARHSNAMRFTAFDDQQRPTAEELIYSIGGGFIVNDRDWQDESNAASSSQVAFPYGSAKQLLEHCKRESKSIAEVALANEATYRPEAETRARLDTIWRTMHGCIERGMTASGTLPGRLQVKRRAGALYQSLTAAEQKNLDDPLAVLDWVDLFALAVSEENANGSRVVTAPTNGAAGIIPAVLEYAVRFKGSAYPDGVHRFLLTAGAIASLYKKNASLSGADVGCQGEVGVACSMAAGALAEYLGGTPEQVEFAAEIGMEHNLGLTCDPIGGLVQIPCIERNAMGSVKAINAARLALRSHAPHYVSLDKVIQTMYATGQDMKTKYKETARGGLAVNFVEC